MPKLSLLGSGAVLLDAADGPFSEDAQRRIWAVAGRISALPGVHEAVSGMNNLLVTFDATIVPAWGLEEEVRALWAHVEPDRTQGKTVDVPVVYGGSGGEDLEGWAEHCGLPVEEAVRLHADGVYSVAAVGAMPGFPYLSGLDPRLARPRRSSPRSVVPEGAVIIGGAQAGIMSQTAPSGWHILGMTSVKLFDVSAEPPSLLQPGDSVRFVMAGMER